MVEYLALVYTDELSPFLTKYKKIYDYTCKYCGKHGDGYHFEIKFDFDIILQDKKEITIKEIVFFDENNIQIMTYYTYDDPKILQCGDSLSITFSN